LKGDKPIEILKTLETRNQFRRKNNPPQVLQRDRRNNEDQRVQAPFQNNLFDEENEEKEVEGVEPEIHCVTDKPASPHLTQSEYEEYLMCNQIDELAQEDQVYQTEGQKKYNLRSKQNVEKKTTSPQSKKTDVPVKASPTKETEGQNKQPVIKSPAHEVKDVEKSLSNFNFEHEIQKIKIHVPLLELVKNEGFKKSFLKVLQPTSHPSPSDSINLQDEKPAVILGPMVEGRDDSSPPFYTSLNVHDKILHNCLMDSGASHNLMPKDVMDELGLEITKTYHDLYSFDSRKVKCLGVIKDLVVTLFQLPMKSMVMDIVVADVPPKFGMLLSRSWIKRLGGTLQMDLSYATIPVFGGEHMRLYREAQLAYIISDEKNPTNHPIYVVDTDLGSSILHLTDSPQPPLEIKNQSSTKCEITGQGVQLWKMYFDGAYSKDGVGAGIVFISPSKEVITLSFKLEFEVTNNIAEYEALILGLRAARDMKIEGLTVFGDVELIVQQVKNIYQTKHVRLRAYRNEVWDLVDNFFSTFNISYIPRSANSIVDSLVVSASNFKVPLPSKIKYDVEIKYRPAIPDNVKHWKVFEDDEELKRFLETVDEFYALHIDQDSDDGQNLHADKFLNKIADHKIVQLPSNHIPKGLVPLERLFDNNDVVVKMRSSKENADLIDCNLGTEEEPKYVKLSKSLSENQRVEYVKLLKEFSDVFAWKYEDLKTYDTNIIEHRIPLKYDTNPFRQNLRKINPMLLPIMEKEVKKLLDAQIIIPLRYSDWVANLVPVRKKNGEIRLCVDFRNLNRCSRKDNYPLPKMEHILQRVTGSMRISMIDGFSGYNQIYVLPEDREKTTFTTPWGTFMYAKMPFGLMNAGETFQRAMDIAFIGEKDKFVVIYLDDITVFSKSDQEHYQHLRKCF
jgi:ribonuclease HI